MNPEMTETLINKFLDSEITPAEQRLLDAELAHNPEAVILLEQLRDLRDQAVQGLRHELDSCVQPSDQLLERAVRHSRTGKRTFSRLLGRCWPAAAVAGFLLALAILYFWTGATESDPPRTQTHLAPDSGSPPANVADSRQLGPQIFRLRPVRRGVDLFTYTDHSGNRLLIEASRDQHVEPATYH